MWEESLALNETFVSPAIIPVAVMLPPETLIEDAIAAMSEAQTSYVLITEQQRPIGIFTERDLVRLIASAEPIQGNPISAVMSQPVRSRALSDIKNTFSLAEHMQQHRLRHLPIVGESGQMAGIVTQSSLLKALDPVEVRHIIERLQQKADQLRAENQACLEARNRELEQSARTLTTKRHNEQQEHHPTDDKVRLQSGLLAAVAQAVIATDLDGKILHWNPYAETLYGWRSAEVLGRSILDITPTDMTRTQAAEIMNCLRQGAQWSGEFIAQRKDGSSFPAWVLDSPIYDEQGTLVGIVGISDDISDRKRLEAERTEAVTALQQAYNQLNQSHDVLESRAASRTAKLRQAEHRWRTLLENVQLVVIGLDTDGKVTYANPFFLRLTGYTADAVIGENWFDRFISSSEHPQTHDYFQQLHTQPAMPLQYQNAVLTQSGEERLIKWNNTVLRDLKNNVTGTMSIGEDITERSAVARLKGEFIAMVSHELRTPLTAIHGGIKLLSQNIVPGQSEQAKTLLQIVAKSSQRLVRLVDDIVELERLELSQHPLHKQWVSTHAVTHQVIDAFQVMARKKNMAIKLSDPGIQIFVDSDRLNPVLTNLLDNAIKFSPPSSTIQISVQKTEAAAHNRNNILFSVCDQGKGLSPEHCKTIFERFIQIEKTSTSNNSGTGLGLTICQNIVDQHGGKLWVESTLGEGSCFYFTIPDASALTP